MNVNGSSHLGKSSLLVFRNLQMFFMHESLFKRNKSRARRERAEPPMCVISAELASFYYELSYLPAIFFASHNKIKKKINSQSADKEETTLRSTRELMKKPENVERYRSNDIKFISAYDDF